MKVRGRNNSREVDNCRNSSSYIWYFILSEYWQHPVQDTQCPERSGHHRPSLSPSVNTNKTSGTPHQSDIQKWIIYECTVRLSIQTNPEVIRRNHTVYPTGCGACSPPCNYDTAIDISWYTDRASIERLLDTIVNLIGTYGSTNPNHSRISYSGINGAEWNEHKCHQMIEIVLLNRQTSVSWRKYNVAMPQRVKNQSKLIFLAEFACPCKHMSHTWNAVLTCIPSSLTFTMTPVIYIM